MAWGSAGCWVRCGGSWQPRLGNLCSWAAAPLFDGGDGSDLSSPCLRATSPIQTLDKMCHQLSSPRTHGVGVQHSQQQRDVPGALGGQSTAASLPSHLENLIHANYAEKSPSDNEYEMEA